MCECVMLSFPVTYADTEGTVEH